MRGQFFFMMTIIAVIVGLHAMFVLVATRRKWFNGKLPQMYRFPHVEIKLFIGFSMGMLNVSLGVLASANTAKGWKLLASLEILTTLLFIGWFLGQGQKFKRNAVWKPLANVRTSRPLPDEDRHGYYSRKEIVDIYAKYKLSQRSCNKFLISKGMQSVASTSVVSYNELLAALDGKGVRFNKISIAQSTFLETCYALIVTPRCEAGKYYHKDPNKDVNYPLGCHFNKFTPKHSDYYFINICRALLVLIVLNFFIRFPLPQVS